MSLSREEESNVRMNLFPVAAKAVLGKADFPWHRDQSGLVTATLEQSSQALAIDVFGTLRELDKPRPILDSLMSKLGGTPGEDWKVLLERLVPYTVLGESRSTQIDVSLECNASLVFIECKFTEPDGGGCSQPAPLTKGANRGIRQCTGDYASQVNPVNGIGARCALTGKGIRYWTDVPKVLSIENDIDHFPCPFTGGWYQWMRNLVACRATAEAARKKPAFAVVYADGPFPMASKVKSREWQEFVALADGKEVPINAVSYQELLQTSVAAAAAVDQPVLGRLAEWVDRKVAAVAATRMP